MGLQIEDGTGSGNQVEVKNNKLLVSGVVSSQEHFANHAEGNAYNIPFSATPTGAGDYFLYLKNTNPDTALSIEGIWIKTAANDFIQVELNDTGVPIGGTDLSPVNANTASGNQALGTFQSGVDITGLNGGNIFHKIYFASSEASVYHNFNMDIVLGANGVLTLNSGAGTVAIEGIIVCNYHGTNN